MKVNHLKISFEKYAGIEELASDDLKLCNQAEEALKTSYSPYSKFKVGAAVELTSGEFVLGSNQENVAYPSGLCAERVALFTIGAKDPNAIIRSIAITAHTDSFTITTPITPCGACLQVMSEFEKKQNHPIEVLLYCLNGEIIKLKSIKSLLPFAFYEDRLES